mgnify:CR=1 FL=1
MRIAYFGGDIYYLCLKHLLERNHQVIRLHTMPETVEQYDMTRRVSLIARDHSIPITRSKPTSYDLAVLENLGCEMIISAGYSHRIPSIENTAIKYAINIHPSLLPIGAGPMPLPRAILYELLETGTTLHKISHEWDAGDIILQKKIFLSPEETLESLYIKSHSQAVSMLQEFLENPESLWCSAKAQDLSKRSFWEKPKADSFIIDFHQPAEVVAKYLRLHRFVSIDGIVEYMKNISVVSMEHNFEPGTTINQFGDTHCVAILNGYVFFTLEKKSVDYYDAIMSNDAYQQ